MPAENSDGDLYTDDLHDRHRWVDGCERDVDAVALKHSVRIYDDGRIAGRTRRDPEEIVGRDLAQVVPEQHDAHDGSEQDRRADSKELEARPPQNLDTHHFPMSESLPEGSAIGDREAG
jgi:hypothetical protein